MQLTWRGMSVVAAVFPAPLFAQSTIPLRQVTPPVASDSGVLKSILGVRHLPDGRVMVNDPSARRVIVFDASLSRFAVALDSTPGSANAYGPAASIILPYAGDSTVFVDIPASAFLVFDPSGHATRSMAAPRPEIARMIVFSATAAQGYDPLGRLVYAQRPPGPQPPAILPPGDSATVFAVARDSVRVLRADPDTRHVDTLGMVARPVIKTFWTIKGGQVTGGGEILNPLPQADDWALLPDGTVALVRGFDYHIDWIGPDGARAATPRMPFDWRRVTQEDKERMIDSAHKAYDARIASLPPIPPGRPPRPPFRSVDPGDMPDYLPPIRTGTVHADLDGNIWILPTTSTLASNALVFDVINREGKVFERVQIPAGRDIAGFGTGGIVYLVSSATPGTKRLERVQVVRR